MLTSVVRTLMLGGSLIVTSLIPAFLQPDVSGIWQIEVRNEAASEKLTVSIHQDQSTLSGSYVGAYQILDVVGVVDGRDITFEYMIDGVRVLYIGELVGKKLSGTYHAGTYDQGQFNAWKVKGLSL